MKKYVHSAFLGVMLSLLSLLVSCSSSREEKDVQLEVLDSTAENQNDFNVGIATDSIPLTSEDLSHSADERETLGELGTMKEPNFESHSLDAAFESNSLNAAQLVVFQQRGAEKLADFINYIEIISNKRYDKQLRLEIRKQIIDLFETDQTLVAIPIDGKKESKPVSKFLDEVYKGGYDSIKVKTDSVVLSPLVKNDNIYKGVITGKIKIQAYRNKKMEHNILELQQAKTIVLKVEKDFGGKKQSVWEVMLGEIE
jgi:hypothetical protein